MDKPGFRFLCLADPVHIREAFLFHPHSCTSAVHREICPDGSIFIQIDRQQIAIPVISHCKRLCSSQQHLGNSLLAVIRFKQRDLILAERCFPFQLPEKAIGRNPCILIQHLGCGHFLISAEIEEIAVVADIPFPVLLNHDEREQTSIPSAFPVQRTDIIGNIAGEFIFAIHGKQMLIECLCPWLIAEQLRNPIMIISLLKRSVHAPGFANQGVVICFYRVCRRQNSRRAFRYEL